MRQPGERGLSVSKKIRRRKRIGLGAGDFSFEIPLRKSRKRASGFTLLEVLLSITIIAVLVAILMSVLRLGYRSVEAGERKMASLDRMRTSFNLIEAQLRSGFPLKSEIEG